MSDAQRDLMRPILTSGRPMPSANVIRRMWRLANCDLDATSANIRSLTNWMSYQRTRQPEEADVPESQPVPSTMAEFVAQMRMRVEDPTPEDPYKMVVLPEICDDEGAVMIPLSCHALLQAPTRCIDPFFCFVIDGKMRRLSHGWILLSLGWMTKSLQRSKTTIRRHVGDSHRRLQGLEFTTRFIPFIIATVPSENQHSVDALMRAVEQHWPPTVTGRPLRETMWQLHRDYAHSFENARKRFYPHSIASGDFAHFTRNLAKAAKESNVSQSGCSYVRTLAHMTRFSPTVELFSALWSHQLEHLRRQNLHRMVAFLERTYFTEVSPLIAREQGRMHLHPGTSESQLISHWLVGAGYIQSGTASGSQCIEAYHAAWESLTSHGRTPSNPAHALLSLSDLMKETAQREKLLTPTPRSVRALIRDPKLFAVNGLEATGEYSAVDLWRYQGSTTNHVIIASETYEQTAYIVFNASNHHNLNFAEGAQTVEGRPPAPKSGGKAKAKSKPKAKVKAKAKAKAAAKATPANATTAAAATTNTSTTRTLPPSLRGRMHAFARHRTITMRNAEGWTTTHNDFAFLHPASVPVDVAAAHRLARLLDATGESLLSQLREHGIIGTADRGVNMTRYRDVVTAFDVAIVGRLASKLLHDDSRAVTCTCVRHMQRSDCPHALFAESLQVLDIRSPSLTLSSILPAARQAAAANTTATNNDITDTPTDPVTAAR